MDEPKNALPKQKPQTYPVQMLREKLRARSVGWAESLARSVRRQTSYDALPCTEYREEVMSEYKVIDQLLYTQNCRSALESALDIGSAKLKYQWRDGRVTETRFRKLRQGRVQVWGLQIQL